MTPSTKPGVHMHDMYTSAHTSISDWQDRLGPCPLHLGHQGSGVPIDLAQVISYHAIGVHIAKKWGIVVCDFKQLWHPRFQLLAKQQNSLACISDQEMGASVPLSKESPTISTLWFLWHLLVCATSVVSSSLCLTDSTRANLVQVEFAFASTQEFGVVCSSPPGQQLTW